MRRTLIIFATLPIVLSSCSVARTAVDVVKVPVSVVSSGVDAATTSQSEADEKRGREIRKAEEERGKQLRLLEERCRKGKPLPTDDCSSFRR